MLAGELPEWGWPGELLARSGLTCVAADLVRECLQALSDRDVDMVAFHPGAAAGSAAVQEVRRFVAGVREAAPSVGVAVAYDRPVSLDQRLLGPRVWVVTPYTAAAELDSMLAEVRGGRADRVPLARPWPAQPPLALAHTRSSFHDRIVPSFNGTSPAFLAVLAALAVKRRTTVFVGISPQEALAVSSNERRTGCRDRVKTVMEQFSRDVNTVRESTGADLRPHLDHCDDPELIVHALKIGFESIMADRWAHSLYAKSSFLRSALSRASPYGVTVEGGIRAIDAADRRKSNGTDPEDLRSMLDIVQPDYISVDVGQHHSCGHGFDRALAAARDISELDDVHHGDDVPSAFEACLELQADLAGRGYSQTSGERRIVHELQDRLASGTLPSLNAWLETAAAEASVAVAGSLVEFQQRWLRRRLAVVDHRALLHDTMIGRGVISGQDADSPLDLELLDQLSWVARRAGTRLVIHGGSSIPPADLRQLHRYGVARVNFGTRPFLRFLNAVTALADEGTVALTQAPRYSQDRLAEPVGSWKDWLKELPQALDPVVAELEHDYLETLQPDSP